MSDTPLRSLSAVDPPADPAGPALVPLLLSANDLAKLLGLSLRSIRNLDSAGKLPRPLRVGGSVRWRRAEIFSWIDSGCPNRETWAARRAARK